MFPVLLAIILIVLFAKSFLPGYVSFSNDGPLGAQNANYLKFPGTLTGAWDDLNDIGTNGGASAPDFTVLEMWLLGPVGYSKFYTPIALFILGIAAWTFFRQLGLSPLAAILGGLAAVLNSSYFGNACWGTAPQQIAMAMVFFAMALVMANSGQSPRLVRWTRLALAGIAVGLSVMEGADNGAIFSLFVAAYVFFKSIIEEGIPIATKVAHGIGRVAVIASFAALIAAQTITSLVGAFIVGTSGMDGDQGMSSQEHWDWATQWSLPKKETLGVFVPGLFGYRLDTPKDMMGFLQKSYQGGEYWGGVGRTPEIDRFFDSGNEGSPPSGPNMMMRFGYAGYYAGILVALVALFAIVQSMRKENSIFPITQRHFIWFWTAALIIGLLLAWGRFAPFYEIIYHLPYFSSIRNPTKFLAIFFLGMIIIFAYGIDALDRGYLQRAHDESAERVNPLKLKPEKPKSWWDNFSSFDRKWSLFCLVAFVASFAAWLIYKANEAGMIHYLGKVGFPDEDAAREIFRFSVGQAGIFLLYFGAAITLIILILTGAFSGKRARIGSLLLGILLVADLGRANLPWIIHWDYTEKYASNPIIDILRDKPYEHRVTDVPSDSPFEGLYRIEWMQHHFPYYNIQCSDIIQSPRVASDLANYDAALWPSPSSVYLMARKWQLTNTRYLLAPTVYLDSLNQELDPVQHRFRILQEFNIVPKPGIENPTEGEQVTAIATNRGDYALFDFTGALPRAKLYSNWLISTNNAAILQTLASPNFDPEKTVLVSGPVPDVPIDSNGDNSGTVDFKSYAPMDIVFNAQADKPSILLLNDKYDAGWHVTVDGKPEQLLRCNYIMRGVYLPPGSHTVQFRFELPHAPLYVTMAAIVIGCCLCAYLIAATRKSASAASAKA